MKESDLKRRCQKWLRILPGVWFYCPSDRFYSGIPDIIFCVNGRFAAIELKNERGKTTDIQDYTIFKIRESGGVVAVCRSFQEFRDFFMSVSGFKINKKGEK